MAELEELWAAYDSGKELVIGGHDFTEERSLKDFITHLQGTDVEDKSLRYMLSNLAVGTMPTVQRDSQMIGHTSVTLPTSITQEEFVFGVNALKNILHRAKDPRSALEEKNVFPLLADINDFRLEANGTTVWPVRCDYVSSAKIGHLRYYFTPFAGGKSTSLKSFRKFEESLVPMPTVEEYYVVGQNKDDIVVAIPELTLVYAGVEYKLHPGEVFIENKPSCSSSYFAKNDSKKTRFVAGNRTYYYGNLVTTASYLSIKSSNNYNVTNTLRLKEMSMFKRAMESLTSSELEQEFERINRSSESYKVDKMAFICHHISSKISVGQTADPKPFKADVKNPLLTHLALCLLDRKLCKSCDKYAAHIGCKYCARGKGCLVCQKLLEPDQQVTLRGRVDPVPYVVDRDQLREENLRKLAKK